MSEYQKIADRQLAKLEALRDKRTQIERDMKNAHQLAWAAIRAMPDHEKGPYLARMTARAFQQFGLTETIRNLLQESKEALTPVQVKERLDVAGYDFSAYKSNPLSSIHSILKRFKPSEVQTCPRMDGGTAYQWKVQRARRDAHIPQAAMSGTAPKKK